MNTFTFDTLFLFVLQISLNLIEILNAALVFLHRGINCYLSKTECFPNHCVVKTQHPVLVRGELMIWQSLEWI